MGTFVKTFITAVALASGVAAWAADNGDIDSLRNRIAAGDKAAAWQQAQQMKTQWESDPGFDYLYGVLALNQQHYNEAQFALERALIADPANLDMRLALAEAYYKLGDQQSAKKQFDLIKQANPPTDILREVNRYIGGQGSTQPGRLMGFVEATLGHDNNINMATGSSEIVNPSYDPMDWLSTPTVTLDANARRQSDMYHAEQFGMDYYKPFDANTGMELRGRFNNRDNVSSDRFDSSSYRMSGSLYQLLGQHMLRGTLAVEDHRISDSEQYTLYGLTGDWLGHDFNGFDLFASAQANVLNYEDDLRDIRQYLVQGGAQRQLGDFKHTAGLLLGDEHALNNGADYNARRFAGVFYDVRYFVNTQHQLFGRLYAQTAEQKGPEPFFVGELRNDKLQQISLGWDWQLTRPLRLRTETGYSHNDSDVGYYAYNRNWLQTSLRYSF